MEGLFRLLIEEEMSQNNNTCGHKLETHIMWESIMRCNTVFNREYIYCCDDCLE